MKRFLILLFVLFAPLAHAADTAILLIDMQKGFTKVVPPQYVSKLVKEQMQLLKWAKAEGHPVLAIEYVDEGKTISPLKEFIESFGPNNFAFIEKRKDDAFEIWSGQAKHPTQILHQWGIQNVIVTGINGPACILRSIKGALEYGFHVYTTPEIVGDFGCNDIATPNATWWPRIEHKRFHPLRSQEELKSCPLLLAGH